MTAPLLIRADRVFDGATVRTGVAVLVRDGVIVEVGPDVTAVDATVVDAPGQTLLPGLIDAHTHVFPGRLEQALAFGVTTELDMFAAPAAVAELRHETTDRAALRSAGTGATAPGGHPCQLVDQGLVPPFPTITGPDEAERFVADRVAEGSDYLKVFLEPGTSTGRVQPTPDDATVWALVAAGHAAGLLVVAHATDADAARRAVAAGVDGLVHVWVDGAAPDLVAAVAAADVFVVPTLTVIDGLWGTGAGARTLASEKRVAPYLDDVSRGGLGMGGVGLAPDGPALATAAVGALHAAGVAILAGTDAANPGTAHGASVHQELRLLVAAGLTPVEALRSATAEPAARFRLADRGRVAPGLVADLVLVAGDPTRDSRRRPRSPRSGGAACAWNASPTPPDSPPPGRWWISAAWTRSRPPRAGSRPSGPASPPAPTPVFTDPLAAGPRGRARARAGRPDGRRRPGEPHLPRPHPLLRRRRPGGRRPERGHARRRSRSWGTRRRPGRSRPDHRRPGDARPDHRTWWTRRPPPTHHPTPADQPPTENPPANHSPACHLPANHPPFARPPPRAAHCRPPADQVVVISPRAWTPVCSASTCPPTWPGSSSPPALLAVKERELAGCPAMQAVRDRLRPGRGLARRPPRCGVRPARPAVWLVEGLLAYLEADAVEPLLDRLTALAAPGQPSAVRPHRRVAAGQPVDAAVPGASWPKRACRGASAPSGPRTCWCPAAGGPPSP